MANEGSIPETHPRVVIDAATGTVRHLAVASINTDGYVHIHPGILADCDACGGEPRKLKHILDRLLNETVLERQAPLESRPGWVAFNYESGDYCSYCMADEPSATTPVSEWEHEPGCIIPEAYAVLHDLADAP